MPILIKSNAQFGQFAWYSTYAGKTIVRAVPNPLPSSFIRMVWRNTVFPMLIKTFYGSSAEKDVFLLNVYDSLIVNAQILRNLFNYDSNYKYQAVFMTMETTNLAQKFTLFAAKIFRTFWKRMIMRLLVWPNFIDFDGTNHFWLDFDKSLNSKYFIFIPSISQMNTRFIAELSEERGRVFKTRMNRTIFQLNRFFYIWPLKWRLKIQIAADIIETSKCDCISSMKHCFDS